MRLADCWVTRHNILNMLIFTKFSLVQGIYIVEGQVKAIVYVWSLLNGCCHRKKSLFSRMYVNFWLARDFMYILTLYSLHFSVISFALVFVQYVQFCMALLQWDMLDLFGFYVASLTIFLGVQKSKSSQKKNLQHILWFTWQILFL